MKKALLIGINYRGTSAQLNGCINDVIGMKEILIGKYNFKEENILVMTDDTNIKPTRENILEGYKWLISKNETNGFGTTYQSLLDDDKATFVFQYSGHGEKVPDRNRDEIDGFDETLCPIDYSTAGMITDDIVRERLVNKVPSNCKLFGLIDACHSGTSFDLRWCIKTDTINKFSLNKEGNYPLTNGDVVMLSGCRDNQTSADVFFNSKSQGALTCAFIHTIENTTSGLTYEKLLNDVRLYIKKNNLSDQIPCLSFGKSLNIEQRVDFN